MQFALSLWVKKKKKRIFEGDSLLLVSLKLTCAPDGCEKVLLFLKGIGQQMCLL